MPNLNPYSSPTALANDTAKTLKLWRRVKYWCWVVIPISIIAGASTTVINMVRTFKTMAEGGGAAAPKEIAHGMETSLSSTSFGFLIAFVAFCIWVWAIIRLRAIERAVDNSKPKIGKVS